MDDKLLALPWQIQLALGGGYAAYSLAYTGVRTHHTAADTTFRAVAFGLIAVAALYALRTVPPLAAGGLAFVATLLGGIGWRFAGIRLWRVILRRTDVSWADDTPSAWARLQGDSRARLTQVSAYLQDGTWLMCDDASQVASLPFGPCILGANGDIAMYVSRIEEPDGTTREADVSDDHYGDKLTYVPATEIRRIVLRHKLPT